VPGNGTRPRVSGPGSVPTARKARKWIMPSPTDDPERARLVAVTTTACATLSLRRHSDALSIAPCASDGRGRRASGGRALYEGRCEPALWSALALRVWLLGEQEAKVIGEHPGFFLSRIGTDARWATRGPHRLTGVVRFPPADTARRRDPRTGRAKGFVRPSSPRRRDVAHDPPSLTQRRSGPLWPDSRVRQANGR